MSGGFHHANLPYYFFSLFKRQSSARVIKEEALAELSSQYHCRRQASAVGDAEPLDTKLLEGSGGEQHPFLGGSNQVCAADDGVDAFYPRHLLGMV